MQTRLSRGCTPLLGAGITGLQHWAWLEFEDILYYMDRFLFLNILKLNGRIIPIKDTKLIDLYMQDFHRLYLTYHESS